MSHKFPTLISLIHTLYFFNSLHFLRKYKFNDIIIINSNTIFLIDLSKHYQISRNKNNYMKPVC